MKQSFLLGLLSIVNVASAQNKIAPNANYSKMPYWIEMIKNPNVNYYEAVTAYEEFWKGKKNPLDESLMCAEDTQGSTCKKQSFADKKERILYLKYVAECKTFERWRSSVKPLVQPDGRILSKTN